MWKCCKLFTFYGVKVNFISYCTISYCFLSSVFMVRSTLCIVVVLYSFMWTHVAVSIEFQIMFVALLPITIST